LQQATDIVRSAGGTNRLSCYRKETGAPKPVQVIGDEIATEGLVSESGQSVGSTAVIASVAIVASILIAIGAVVYMKKRGTEDPEGLYNDDF
jgi:hypothetical protein